MMHQEMRYASSDFRYQVATKDIYTATVLPSPSKPLEPPRTTHSSTHQGPYPGLNHHHHVFDLPIFDVATSRSRGVTSAQTTQ